MHEAGLARAIAAWLRERGLEPADVRLFVRGGHTAPADFDSALRVHLALEMPEVDPALEIVHIPVPRVCAGCGRTFESADAADACPACGGTALPAHLDEQVEIEPR